MASFWSVLLASVFCIINFTHQVPLGKDFEKGTNHKNVGNRIRRHFGFQGTGYGGSGYEGSGLGFSDYGYTGFGNTDYGTTGFGSSGFGYGNRHTTNGYPNHHGFSGHTGFSGHSGGFTGNGFDGHHGFSGHGFPGHGHHGYPDHRGHFGHHQKHWPGRHDHRDHRYQPTTGNQYWNPDFKPGFYTPSPDCNQEQPNYNGNGDMNMPNRDNNPNFYQTTMTSPEGSNMGYVPVTESITTTSTSTLPPENPTTTEKNVSYDIDVRFGR